MFQANPTKYDIDGALSELAEVDWVVRQYESDVHAGDRVYIWKSGAEGGIIATAQVNAEPAVASKTDDPFVLDLESFAEPELSVKLRISDVLPKPLLRSDLVEHPVLKYLGVISFANATNFAVTAEQDAALLALLGGEGALSVHLPEITEAAAKRVFLPKEWLDRVVDLLRAKRQLIFYGPPGTGKTFVAQEIAEDITREGGDFVLVQFHPSYSYEDFFEGYRPYEQDGGCGAPLPADARAPSAARGRSGGEPVSPVRPHRRRDQPRQHREDLRRAALPARVSGERRSSSNTRRTNRSRCRGTCS